MHVLVLYPFLPSPEAGHGSALLVSRLLRDLVSEVELTLVCAYRPGERSLVASVRPLCHHLYAVERRFASDMGPLRRVSEAGASGLRLLATGYPLPVVKLRRPELRRAVVAAAESAVFDVAHVELAVLAQYQDALPKGVPSILVDHEAAGPPGEETERWSAYVREHYTPFDRVLTLSDEDRQELLALEPGLRIEVRPPGLDVPASIERRPEPERVLFFGSAAHEPNRDALAFIAESVAPALRSLRPGARLVCSGITPDDGPEAEAAARAATAAGVELLGRVPDIAAEIDRAAVVLAPLRRGRGVRIKNLEAMARGAPLVTTSLGLRGLHALGPDACRVADDGPALASAVAGLLADPDTAKRLGARARAAVARHYSSEQQSRRTLELWQRLARARSGPPDP